MNYLGLTLIFFMQYMCGCFGFYYWKNYHGKIPTDAFDAGKDKNGEKVYIGQTFIKNDTLQGIYPTRIILGEDVYAAIHGAQKGDNFIQILCSNNPDSFEWLPTNSTHLHLIKTDNEMVRGGIEYGAWVNIGRFKYHGNTVVGKVLAGHIGNAEMWFVDNHDEVKADSYEVLTYNHISRRMIAGVTISEQKKGFYYWKDYQGKIPVDAFDVGKDINGENVYIGQALVKNDQGIYPARIIRGKDIYAAIHGAQEADNFIQILCSDIPGNFKWLPANSTHLHLIKTDNEMVRSGIEDGDWLYVGRFKYEGSTVVGKVLAGHWHIGNAEMWFVHNHDEVKASSYEVLTYNHISSKMIGRVSISDQKKEFYYWKNYYGKIPIDAFDAGKDINGQKVYIGQVFIKIDTLQGIYPTRIIRGEDVYASIYGAQKADNFIQILCSNNPGNFEWLPANATHLHLIKTDNEVVRGGIEDDTWIYIGRFKYHGSTVVGKVLAGHIGNAEMWFVYNHDEVKADSYELLTYNHLSSKMIPRFSISDRKKGFYYWKDHYGKIPVDAFDVRKDIYGEKVYIGQAFIRTDPYQGIYPTHIIQGKDIYAPIRGALKADNFIQILCSNNPDNFEWLPANSTHLHLIKTDNEVVRGGIEDDKWVNIGRFKYQGDTVVGKVLAGHIGNAEMWFEHKQDEVEADSYEVLTYNDISDIVKVPNIVRKKTPADPPVRGQAARHF